MNTLGPTSVRVRFKDRHEAGLPVAATVAGELRAPLDVLVVRRLGVPGHAELTMGSTVRAAVLVVHQK